MLTSCIVLISYCGILDAALAAGHSSYGIWASCGTFDVYLNGS